MFAIKAKSEYNDDDTKTTARWYPNIIAESDESNILTQQQQQNTKKRERNFLFNRECIIYELFFHAHTVFVFSVTRVNTMN